MIGSIGEEAERIRKALPAGHGHVVMDTSLLPSTLKCLELLKPHRDDLRSIFEQAGIVRDDF